MRNQISVAAIVVGLTLLAAAAVLLIGAPARAQNIIHCTKTLDGLNEYVAGLREARDSYVASRNKVLRLAPQSLNSSEMSEYDAARRNIESKRLYVLSASAAVVDWIRDARQHSCASDLDLDRIEREIANIFLMIKDGERTPLPKRDTDRADCGLGVRNQHPFADCIGRQFYLERLVEVHLSKTSSTCLVRDGSDCDRRLGRNTKRPST